MLNNNKDKKGVQGNDSSNFKKRVKVAILLTSHLTGQSIGNVVNQNINLVINRMQPCSNNCLSQRELPKKRVEFPRDKKKTDRIPQKFGWNLKTWAAFYFYVIIASHVHDRLFLVFFLTGFEYSVICECLFVLSFIACRESSKKRSVL